MPIFVLIGHQDRVSIEAESYYRSSELPTERELQDMNLNNPFVETEGDDFAVAPVRRTRRPRERHCFYFQDAFGETVAIMDEGAYHSVVREEALTSSR